jgi:nucleotide-binding universal stress UspA family protein
MTARNEIIVVGVDGSDESIGALRWAANYAKAVGGSLHAVRTWHYPWAMQTAPEQIDESVESQVRKELEAAVQKADLDVEVEVRAVEGHASLALVKESAKADLLVVGNRGHGAFHELMLGSVSLHCVTNASCPVVVVRPNAAADH